MEYVVVGIGALTACTSLATLLRSLVSRARHLWWLPPLAAFFLLLFTGFREGILIWRDYSDEQSNQELQNKIKVTCDQLEKRGDPLRHTEGGKKACDYATHVNKTTAWARTLENLSARLTTVHTLSDWLKQNYALASLCLVLGAVALTLAMDRADQMTTRYVQVYQQQDQLQLPLGHAEKKYV